MRKKFINLTLTVMLCILTVILGVGIWRRLSGLLAPGESQGGGNSPAYLVEPERPDNPALLRKLCGELERMLEEDTAIHLNTMLMAPEEYEIWNRLPEILQIGEEGLTDEEWLLYQKLRWHLDCYERGRQLPDYSNGLSDLTGILNKLPELFYTCHFETAEDIDAYVEMRGRIPDMLNRLQESLEERRGGMGFLSDILDSRIADCEEQASEDSIFLLDFERKIHACDFLTEEEKTALIEENRDYVENTVRESYESLRVALCGIPPTKGYQGLGEYEGGEEYYDYWLMITTGSGQEALEMYTYLEGKRVSLERMLPENPQNPEPGEGIGPEAVMAYLCGRTVETYPGVPRLEFSVETIPEESRSELCRAFYFKDSRTGRNYIYITQDAEWESGLTLYQTLAHEALPGHMYSYNYPGQSDFPRLQEQLKCLGYSEGWAVYAEIAAAEWIGEGTWRERYLQQVYQKLYDEIVLCQIDIGIHAMGWTAEDIEDFSAQVYGGSSRQAAETVMETLINNPGVYQPYVMGYFGLEDLRQKYCTQMGVPEREFIEAWQSCGQAPFSIVDGYMDRVFGAQAGGRSETETAYYR